MKHSSLFTELSPEEAMQTNGGGYLQLVLGNALGGIGSAWWSRNFWGNVNAGNINGAINVTDRYVNGLVNSLRRFGIRV
jgi:hypothetical protein